MKPKPVKRLPTEADLLMWTHLHEIRPYTWIKKEFRFWPSRRWRLDFAIATEWHRVGIEIDGGAFVAGRHNRGFGFIKDMEKQNYAVLCGWKILRFTPQQVLDGTAIAFIKRVLDT